ncbi:hypothetical protein MITS9504_02451 [Synechococcus sp. MIT S9504]|nr:hypothetical protein MITS9504_02451 [Synechococcus sp. MIT S9504]
MQVPLRLHQTRRHPLEAAGSELSDRPRLAVSYSLDEGLESPVMYFRQNLVYELLQSS